MSSQILGHDGACPSMFERARIDIMRLAMNSRLFGTTASNRILICSFFAARVRAQPAVASRTCWEKLCDRT